MINSDSSQNVSNMKGGVKALLIVGLLSVATLAKEDKEKEDIGTVIGIDLGTTYSWWVYINENALLKNNLSRQWFVIFFCKQINKMFCL